MFFRTYKFFACHHICQMILCTCIVLKMNKEFLKWHVLKSDLDRQAVSAKFQEREIWWCSLGCNIGYEQDGKHELFERPVLIVRKFNADLFWGLPLSSK